MGLLGLGSGRTRRGHQRRRGRIVGTGRNRFAINILHRREGCNNVVIILARQHAARYRRGRGGRRHGATGRDQPLLGGGRGRAARRGGRIRTDRVVVVVVGDVVVTVAAAAIASGRVTQQLLM